MELKKAIREKALAEGFSAVGFTDAGMDHGAKAGLDAYLAAGLHGDMGWMAEKVDRRGDPQVLWPGARSIIVLAMNYGPPDDPLAVHDHKGRGAISVYARGRDYHDVVKKRLKKIARWLVETQSCEVKVFVDTAPVMEKPLAQRAGLGWQGKHTNIVSRETGSWLFLGEIFTSLELPPDPPETDHCGDCTRCMDACPTGAITAPYRIDPRRCISYLTIEHRGDIAKELADQMGNRIYGCDDCLAACPFNKFATPTLEAALLPKPELMAPRLKDLQALSEAEFRLFFSGSPVKRTGHARFGRNVRIAIANSGKKSG